MESQTIWTILCEKAVEVLTACLAAIAPNRVGNRGRWPAVLGELVRNAGKGISA
jgi:hypothetical protein